VPDIDRHREKPLSVRLGAERQRLDDYARQTGQPVRRVIKDAVRAWLDKHTAGNGETGETS
jgi:predicted DNA-binding protein